MTSPLTSRELALTVERVRELRDRVAAVRENLCGRDGDTRASAEWRDLGALCDAWLASHATPPPARQELPDVDELAQIIRRVDGTHSLGAGVLAERILEALNNRSDYVASRGEAAGER